MSDKNNPNATEELLALGAAYADPLTVPEGTAPFIVTRNDFIVQDLERLRSSPTRKRGTVVLHDQKSFIAMVTRHSDHSTLIYATIDPPCFVAVFDEHGVFARWREHRAVWKAPLSPEWRTWKACDGKVFTQESFARFIEDNLPDIVEPVGADMLEIARTLEAKKKVNFASGVRLSNGEHQITYEEEIQGSAAKGRLQIPEVFALGIPVLQGGMAYRVEARLRYRIADGKLSIWFDLVRPHKILEDAVLRAEAEIIDSTAVAILHGEA